MTDFRTRQAKMGILKRYRMFHFGDVIHGGEKDAPAAIERKSRQQQKFAVLWGRNNQLFRYLFNYDGKSAYICGPTGSGKTAMLCAFVNTQLRIPRTFAALEGEELENYLSQYDENIRANAGPVLKKTGGRGCLYVTEHDLCGDLDYFNQARWKNQGLTDPIQRAISTDVLVLDELGAKEGKKDRHKDAIEYMIDQRYRDRKPIIIASNHALFPVDFVRNTYGARVASRLLEMCGPRQFELLGDWRHER